MIKYLLITVVFVCSFFSQTFAHSDTLDVIHYNINLEITDFENKTINGYTVLNIKTIVDNVDVVCLDLLQLQVDSVKITGQSNINFLYNDTLLQIIPEQAFNTNDEFELYVYYQGEPVVDPSGWGGFYFSGQRAFNLGVGFDDVPHNYGRVWYPCVDDFVDRATYTFNITVKDNHKAICGGILQNETDNGDGTKTFEWLLTDDIPTYLSSVAVGEYVAVLDTFYGIEEVIPIEIDVYPGDSALAVSSFQNLKTILSIYENKFGPYRWQRVGYVAVPFNSGAMEHACNIAIPAVTINGNTNYQDLFAHELAHHWFGDLVTCHNAGDMWLNEGWAVYCESIIREELYGKKDMLNYRRGTHAEVVRYAHIEDDGFLPLYDIPLDRTYGTTVYNKGSGVAHTLRCYLGDELFFSGLTAYLNEFANNDATSYDFRDFMSENTGVNLTDWFNDWVFTGGFPHYAIDSFHVLPEGNEYTIDVFVKQQLRGRSEYLTANIVPITFMADDYSDTTINMYFSEITASESFVINFEPKFIFCDYYEQVADATVDKSRFIKNTSTISFSDLYLRIKASEYDSDIDSIFMHITHNWAAPDPFITDMPGIILANHRFWTIQGDFPETCTFKGDFTYSNLEISGSTGYLDNEFITNDLDSIILLYRPNRSANWQITNAENSTIMKRFSLDNLQAGEYTLAIKDWDLYQSINKTNFVSSINIYPNPSSDIFTINIPLSNCSKVKICDISGKTIDIVNIQDKNQFVWNASKSCENGLYFMIFEDKTGRFVEMKKILLHK